MEEENIDKLVSYLRLTQDELKLKLKTELEVLGRETCWNNGFLYSPGTHPVLLIAHLDTFHKKLPTEFYVDDAEPKSRPGGDLRCKGGMGIGGDDRCGVYIVMEIIRQLNCHVLFCEDEEIGRIGAEKFSRSEIRPEVQFIVEFDRRGKDDAVFYDCKNEDFIKFVEQFGFSRAEGTFSDISTIAPELKIAAVNLSSGYYEAHIDTEYIRLDEVESVIERAIPLIADVSKKYEYV